MNTQPFEFHLPLLISYRVLPMALTINLYTHHQLRAKEVNNEPIDGLLAIKVVAKHFLLCQFSCYLARNRDFRRVLWFLNRRAEWLQMLIMWE
jgi:hypothetical protein